LHYVGGAFSRWVFRVGVGGVGGGWWLGVGVAVLLS